MRLVATRYNRAAAGDIGPHALANIHGTPHITPSADLSVTYTDFNKIATLSEADKSYSLIYGADMQRKKSIQTINDVTSTKYYLGDYEEETDGNSNTRKIHYLSGGAIYVETMNTSSQEQVLYYGYTDNQGSLIALTDAAGNVVEKYAYDPWGARRNPQDWAQKDNRNSRILNRGYTGHSLSRFLSGSI